MGWILATLFRNLGYKSDPRILTSQKFGTSNSFLWKMYPIFIGALCFGTHFLLCGTTHFLLFPHSARLRKTVKIRRSGIFMNASFLVRRQLISVWIMRPTEWLYHKVWETFVYCGNSNAYVSKCNGVFVFGRSNWFLRMHGQRIYNTTDLEAVSTATRIFETLNFDIFYSK